jgi:16S rRNA (guanine527-N7)-methyltransferase
MTPADLLASGLDQLDVNGPDGFADHLLAFANDLIKWNKVYNLTAIKRLDEIVIQHLLDSLSIANYITDLDLIDVGTGGGFPGIPLALLKPQCRVTLLDSNIKKTRFLQQMCINHQLTNCEVLHSRAESCSAVFTQVVCRAFASIPNILGYAGHLVAADGQLLAMKAHLGDEVDEKAISTAGFYVQEIQPLQVPYLDAERHLIVLGRVDQH